MSKTGIIAIVLGIIALAAVVFGFIKKAEAPSSVPTNEPAMEETILPDDIPDQPLN